jgi:hypothetical protein
MNLPSPPTTVSHPSPPLSPRDDDASLVHCSKDRDVVADYLDNMAFHSNNNASHPGTGNLNWDAISIGELQYPQMDNMNMNTGMNLNLGLPMTCAPTDILMSLPTPVDDGLYPYDFDFNQDMMMNVHMLPSPPSTTSPSLTSSSDPPSPAMPNALPHNVFNGIDTSKLKLTFSPSAVATATANVQQSKKSSALQPKEAKTKSSHTTIERRYRTNLNSRLISLRLAVPALRVLDKDNSTGFEPDDRGYVDGVKIAKKNSKAIVLGKAEEYIL